jgi:hypothetical protein
MTTGPRHHPSGFFDKMTTDDWLAKLGPKNDGPIDPKRFPVEHPGGTGMSQKRWVVRFPKANSGYLVKVGWERDGITGKALLATHWSAPVQGIAAATTFEKRKDAMAARDMAAYFGSWRGIVEPVGNLGAEE